MIRNVQLDDAKQLADIYNYYVHNSIVTFDLTPFTTENFKEKIKTISPHFPFMVYEENGMILGYSYANKWRQEPAYNNTVESTVYVRNDSFGKGIGTKLYAKLIERLKELQIHVVIGGLSLPNDESVYLHEKFGFKKVAHFSEVGFKFNRWADVAFYQLILNSDIKLKN